MAQAETSNSLTWKKLLRPVATIVAIGSFLAVLGPFGSDQIGWPWVWFYWVFFIAFGSLFGHGFGAFANRFLPDMASIWVHAGVIVCVSIPVTIAVVGLNAYFNLRSPGLLEVVITFSLVLVITGFASFVTYAVELMTGPKSQSSTPAQARPGRALIDKLPHGLRQGEIYALKSEDHYLRVYTSAGEGLILMRLSDAIAAVESLNGARTHRSWWVAKSAVTRAQKGDSRGVLILKDDTEAPVSRTYYAPLRDAGWF